MSDFEIVAMAVLTAAAAWWRVPVPIVPSLVAAVVGVGTRWPWLVCLAAAGLSGGLAARAITKPVNLEPVHEWVTLLDDPSPSGPFVRATVDLDGRHFTVSLAGGSGRGLMAHSAGEQLLMSARTRPLRNAEQWLRWRHVVGGLDNVVIEDWRVGAPLTRSTNQVRAVLSHGAEVMPPKERALFLGLAVGDDRAE